MEKLGWEEELLGLGQLMRGCFNFVFFLPTFTLGDQRTLGSSGTPEWFHFPIPTRASCKVQAFGVRCGPGWSDPVGGWHPVIVQCGLLPCVAHPVVCLSVTCLVWPLYLTKLVKWGGREWTRIQHVKHYLAQSNQCITHCESSFKFSSTY